MTEKSKEVVNWKEKLAESAKEVAKTERPSVSYISLRAGVITYEGEQVEDLQGVVVAASYDRSYYDQPYDADVQSAPVCFAQSMDEEHLVPHESVTEAQSANCAVCPLSKFGSASNGKSQACKLRRKLAILPFGSKDYAESEMAVLAVTPTSSPAWSSFSNKLASTAGLPPWGAGVKITTKPDPRYQFKVLFEPLGPVPEKDLAAVHGRIEGATDILLTPYDLAAEGGDVEEPEESKKY